MAIICLRNVPHTALKYKLNTPHGAEVAIEPHGELERAAATYRNVAVSGCHRLRLLVSGERGAGVRAPCFPHTATPTQLHSTGGNKDDCGRGFSSTLGGTPSLSTRGRANNSLGAEAALLPDAGRRRFLVFYIRSSCTDTRLRGSREAAGDTRTSLISVTWHQHTRLLSVCAPVSVFAAEQQLAGH
ncbi:unnamed protein product [Pleuronectes platessa]|uniref:Uncharacterized protein n=1 Tax=Pleuronectes platessa TaxID=8262 RepID=A0A9N7ZEA0_PLEPL|nr:unnamed protein product [Pleuronectes platessa]